MTRADKIMLYWFITSLSFTAAWAAFAVLWWFTKANAFGVACVVVALFLPAPTIALAVLARREEQ